MIKEKNFYDGEEIKSLEEIIGINLKTIDVGKIKKDLSDCKERQNGSLFYDKDECLSEVCEELRSKEDFALSLAEKLYYKDGGETFSFVIDLKKIQGEKAPGKISKKVKLSFKALPFYEKENSRSLNTGLPFIVNGVKLV